MGRGNGEVLKNKLYTCVIYIKGAMQLRGLELVVGQHSAKMMLLVLLSVLFATTMAAPAAQSLTVHDDGSYKFYYETGKEGGSHSRSEIRNPDGVVIGKFSYEDPDGEIREVNYRADGGGFIAQGDVGVKGAPKGQFPVIQDKKAVPETSTPASMPVDNQPAEPKEDNQQTEPVAKATQKDSYHNEEEDRDEMQDIALEDSPSNDPPDAFPPGFFLHQFHGLRRLPEPTPEEQPTTTETPKDDKLMQPEEKDVNEEKAPELPAPDDTPVEGSMFSFAPQKLPFPAQTIPHQEWASAMFHQPVYVFSYRQPDSYGYHYYF